MNLQPYTGHAAPRGRLRYDGSNDLSRLDYKLRAAVCDDGGLMIDAADMLQVVAKERDAANIRVTELEAELITARALAREREAA